MSGWEVQVRAASDPRSEEARRIEAEVFLEAFGNTSETMEEEYRPYENLSTFLHLTGPDGPVGAARLLIGPAEELKSVRDAAKDPWGLYLDGLLNSEPFLGRSSLVIDVATLAVLPPFRRQQGLATAMLCQEMIRLCEEIGASLSIAVLDTRVLAIINRLLCDTWRPYPGAEPMPYLGSASSVPVTCDPRELETTMLKVRPELHRETYRRPVSA